jgi:hypothetical protein
MKHRDGAFFPKPLVAIALALVLAILMTPGLAKAQGPGV